MGLFVCSFSFGLVNICFRPPMSHNLHLLCNSYPSCIKLNLNTFQCSRFMQLTATLGSTPPNPIFPSLTYSLPPPLLPQAPLHRGRCSRSGACIGTLHHLRPLWKPGHHLHGRAGQAAAPPCGHTSFRTAVVGAQVAAPRPTATAAGARLNTLSPAAAATTWRKKNLNILQFQHFLLLCSNVSHVPFKHIESTISKCHLCGFNI